MREKVWQPDRIADQLQMRAIRLRRPLSCTLELTCHCNFHCVMCYIRMNEAQAAAHGRMRTPEEWLDMARQLREAGVLYLHLTGGECTLYPGFERLYARLSEMGFRLSVMSNAGAYTDSVRRVFTQYPPLSVAVTLYGGCAATYGRVTGDAGGFDRVVDNIRFLQSAGIPVTVNFTMIRQNAQDYPKVAELCRTLGIAFTLNTDITPHRYDASYSDAMRCSLTPAERACVACHSPSEVDIALNAAKTLEQELSHFTPPQGPAGVLPEQEACIAGSAGCAIAWNGDMQTCVSLNAWQSVKPFEIGFEAAWAQLKAAQDRTFARPSVCAQCEMRTDCDHNCPGRRFEGTGNIHTPDPRVCQYTYLLRLYRARRGTVSTPGTPGCV